MGNFADSVTECIVIFQNSHALSVIGELTLEVRSTAKFHSRFTARCACRNLVQRQGGWACIYPYQHGLSVAEHILKLQPEPGSVMIRQNIQPDSSGWRNYERSRRLVDDEAIEKLIDVEVLKIPALPINKDDEKIVDELVAKRVASLKTRQSQRSIT